MTIPILFNHNFSEPPIGKAEWTNGRLHVHLFPPLKREDIFRCFGNVGIKIIKSTESTETVYIEEFEILEFSLEGG
jgi:hypothetical protein